MSLEKPKIDDSFRVLHEKAHEYITDQQEILEDDFGFGQFSNYSVDWDESSITFHNEDNSSLKMTFQVVGTLETDTSKWSWKWNDPSISAEEREELEIIKNYGDFYDFSYLTIPSLEVTTPIAWALTAIAGYLRISKGIFRIQQDTNAHFVYFKEVLT
ncbi:hypothetical protein M3B46_03390 [Sphingobacterium daejeonense]|uniref:DUF6882 domain-containing protein n=1 Tax=Sphingobacterium daejeonense TaxID=371142 RepID=UPI0021A84B87|nr:DUF6882 domain-containing protein [Sphingobacterium daejeonense]MCT1530021.1 hypothetical protein [Sphingobacterium daejeonense]